MPIDIAPQTLIPGYVPPKPKPKPGDRVKYVRPKKEKPWKPNPFRQPIADQWETEFRHMKWSGTRDKIRSHLQKNGTCMTAMDRWDNCGAECMIEYSVEAKRYRLRASYCKNRHCRPCNKARAGVIAANLRERVELRPERSQDRYRFITLTIAHTDKPLLDQIKFLTKCFTKLRNSKVWKKSQRGGCAMLEVLYTAKGEWHPHIHIIGEGDFIRQEELSTAWSKITGGSFKVDVRKISSGKDAVHYVSKYITKGTNEAVWDVPEAAAEWIIAMRGIRLCATYGTWRGFALLTPSPVHKYTDWKPVALMTTVVRKYGEGDEWAIRTLHHLIDALQYDPGRQRASRRNDKSD